MENIAISYDFNDETLQNFRFLNQTRHILDKNWLLGFFILKHNTIWNFLCSILILSIAFFLKFNAIFLFCAGIKTFLLCFERKYENRSTSLVLKTTKEILFFAPQFNAIDMGEFDFVSCHSSLNRFILTRIRKFWNLLEAKM